MIHAREVSIQEKNQYTEAAFTDFTHIGPGTLAGRYIRTFWHPMFVAEELPLKAAKPIRILGEDLTLYRGEGGKPHLVAFRCAHRSAQLSLGWVEGDAIRCFYHGWKYDGSGQCIEQPAERKSFCDKVKILSYPIQEYIGLIFAYMGEGEPPELPRYQDYEEVEGMRVVRVLYKNFNFFQDFENGMDRVHTGFVHQYRPGAFDGAMDSPEVRAEEDEWGLKTFAEHASGRVGIQRFGMPNIQHTLSTFTDADNLTFKMPVDDEHTAKFNVRAIRGPDAMRKYAEDRARRVGKPWCDPMSLAKAIAQGELKYEDVDPYTTDMVALEDDLVLFGQGVIVDRRQECLGSADVPVRLVRKIWERELGALAEGRPLKNWKYVPGITAHRRR